MASITEEKQRLRRQVRAQLAALSPQALRAGDDALFARFLALPQVERAGRQRPSLPSGASPAGSRRPPG